MAFVGQAVDRDVDEVGWYRYGPTPGDNGSAVLSAHVDSRSQGPGVFFRLGTLTPGDFVEVELERPKARSGDAPLPEDPRKIPNLILKLRKEMKKAAGKMEFERAAELMVAGMKSMASELKVLQKDDSPPPLLRAKLLAEMADNDLVVTNEELLAIGVNTRSYRGESFEAYGYAFTAHRHHNSPNAERFWTCGRLFAKKGQVTPVQSTGRSVGFVADEPTAAMFNFNQPVLPHWS